MEPLRMFPLPLRFTGIQQSSARNGGATRLEICSSLAVGGGITPSLGLVRSIQEAAPKLDIMVTQLDRQTLINLTIQ
jgi:copper homeostasis protein CutC